MICWLLGLLVSPTLRVWPLMLRVLLLARVL